MENQTIAHFNSWVGLHRMAPDGAYTAASHSKKVKPGAATLLRLILHVTPTAMASTMLALTNHQSTE